MISQVPVWMSFIIIFIYLMLIVLVTVGFQRILDGFQGPDRHRALLWSISSFLTVWLSLAIVLATQGFFRTGPEAPAPRIAYALIPFILGYGVLFVSPTFRRLVAEIPPQWIIGLQANRLLGGLFLVAYAQGQLPLPALMAIPAGVGDLLVGLAAPVVAYLFIAKHRNARRIGVLWNMAGIIDLLIAVATGVLTSPGPFHFLALETPNLLMSAYPFAIIPAFGVPVWVLLHFFSLRGLMLKGEI